MGDADADLHCSGCSYRQRLAEDWERLPHGGIWALLRVCTDDPWRPLPQGKTNYSLITWVQKEGVVLTTFCFFSSGKHYDFRLWGFCYNIRHRKPWQPKLPYSVRWSCWPGQAVSDRTLCFVPVVWSLSTGRLASRSATKKSTCAAGDLRGARTPALPFSRLILCLWTPRHGYTSHFLKIS